MMIFEHVEYRKYLDLRLRAQPRKGYGQLSKLAKYLNMNSAYLSQVMKGEKSFSLEQGIQVARFLNLTESDTEYWILLISHDRAGRHDLKDYYLKKVKSMQHQFQQISNLVSNDTKLDELTKSVFYSDWVYSGIRQATAIPGHHSIEKIAQFLGLKPQRVKEVIDFLVQSGLCVLNEKGYTIGPRRTHLEESSPLKKNHHQNWRVKAVEHLFDSWEQGLHYTSPMTVTAADAKSIRNTLLQMIKDVNAIADASRSEELVCLNLDFFRIRND